MSKNKISTQDSQQAHTPHTGVSLQDNRPRSIVQQKTNPLKKTNPATAQQHAPVQRYVFVGQDQIRPNGMTDMNGTPQERLFIRDKLARQYTTMSEFKRHAAGQTDYIGNILSGKYLHTWVRFSPNKMNVLGENHSDTPLDVITNAVGTTSFSHERFTDGAFNHGPMTNFIDNKENAPRYAKYGVGGHPTAHMGEALLPKVAFVLNSLQHVTRQNLLDWTQANYDSGDKTRRENAYNGIPYLTYMKYALATAIDKKPQYEQHGKTWSDQLQVLYAQLYKVMDAHNGLAKQIIDSPAGALLGDIVKPDAIAFIQLFSVTYLKLADISRENDKNYQQFKHVDPKTDINVYMKWRDTYMIREIFRSYQAHTRYFGLGNKHLTNLLGNIHDMGMDVHAENLITYMPSAQTHTQALVKRGETPPISKDLKDLGKVIKGLSKTDKQEKGGH